MILDLLSTCPTVSSILGENSSLLQVFSSLVSLSRTELTDHRPARDFEVFGVQIKPTQLAFRRTVTVYLLTY